jgi:hypothetical protein
MATKYWNATTDHLASTAGNWSPAGVPGSGDDVVFDNHSTYECYWDATVTVKSVTLAANFAGGIVQVTAPFSILGDLLVQGGSKIYSNSGMVTVFGNVTRSGGGTLGNAYNLNLTIAGSNSTLTSDNSPSLEILNIVGNATIAGATSWLVGSYAYGYLKVTGTLTIGAGASVQCVANGICQIYGTVTGPGYLYRLVNGTATLTDDIYVGWITAPFMIYSTGTYTITLNQALPLHGPFVVGDGSHATTLDIRSFPISCTTFTVSASATLDADSPHILTAGNVTIAGTIDWGTSVVEAGASGTWNIYPSQPYDMKIDSGVVVTLGSNLTITHAYTNAGSVTLSGYNLAYPANVSGAYLAGIDLGHIQSIQCREFSDATVTPQPMNDSSDTIVMDLAGVTREYNISSTFVSDGTGLCPTGFINAIRSMENGQQIVDGPFAMVLSPPDPTVMPAETVYVMVIDFTFTKEEAKVNQIEYTLRLVRSMVL